MLKKVWETYSSSTPLKIQTYMQMSPVLIYISSIPKNNHSLTHTGHLKIVLGKGHPVVIFFWGLYRYYYFYVSIMLWIKNHKMQSQTLAPPLIVHKYPILNKDFSNLALLTLGQKILFCKGPSCSIPLNWVQQDGIIKYISSYC